jgi:pimeloyl-ACP methyl ester carboxylesterase
MARRGLWRDSEASSNPHAFSSTMNSFLKLAALGLAASLMAGSAAAATPIDAAKPSVVIVHGAFADGSDWAKVIPLLQAQGLRVTAVQNPLSSLADDAAAAKRAIDAQPGKVVLVGHSWGGAVITEAGANPKVSALVYVAAFAPEVGQPIGELGKNYPKPSGLAHFAPDAAGWLYLTPEGMSKHFAQDLPAATTAVMTATQGPIFGAAFGDKVSVAAWKQKPSWYLLAEADRMIAPELQRATAQAIKAKLSTVNASHVPQQSQPAAVAAVILDAVQSVN